MEAKISEILIDPKQKLDKRFRALFSLRNINTDSAVAEISKCFTDESALLKHECAFCLGQMENPAAVGILVKILKDKNENVMVRHEAGEALGAIAHISCIPALVECIDDPDTPVIIKETCELSQARLRWINEKSGGDNSQIRALPAQNIYGSVDPAPPSLVTTVSHLRDTLLNTELSLFERYRAMFSLRNIGTDDAIDALTQGLFCKSSALLRHEVAYVLGQLQKERAVKDLEQVVNDSKEHYMVRHECVEALGSIATPECQDILRRHLTDEDQVVAESCQIGLDMYKVEKSKEISTPESILNE